MKKFRNIISMLLVVVMCLSLMPMISLAGGGEKTTIQELHLTSNIDEILKVGHAVEAPTFNITDPGLQGIVKVEFQG